MKTKHLIFTLLVMVFGFAGCFGEKKEITQEEKNSIIAEAKSAYSKNRTVTTSGVQSGIYLKDNDGNVRLYGFEDFFNMTVEQESAFVANWGNCVAESSYIVFSDNKAATIKLVRDNNGSFTAAKTATTISVNDTGYTKDSIVLNGLSGLKEYANGDGPRVTFSSESENVLLNTSLTLTTMDGAVIRYSENDSSVTESSTQYTTAISINGAKAVRAKAYMTGWIEGTEYRKSYGIGYTVTYNGNGNDGGSVPTDSNKYSLNSSVVIIGNTVNLSKTGYVLKGWNTKATGDGTSYSAGATINITENITLYAHWEKDIKKIFIENNGGIGFNYTTVERGGLLPSITKPIKKGYIFGGYFKDSGLSTVWDFSIDKVIEDTTLYTKWVKLDMVSVAAGITSASNGNITLSKPIYVGKYEVTQEQWLGVMYGNKNNISIKPSYYQGENRPVEMISWYDALVFCNRLSIEEGLIPVYTIVGSTNPDNWGSSPKIPSKQWDLEIIANSSANGYRIPETSEWEYIFRGGADGLATVYSGSNNIEEVAWYVDNNKTNGEIEGTKSVGRKLPNELGIYDVSGNVCEWIYNRVGYGRTAKGGSFMDGISECSVTSIFYRFSHDYSRKLGIRIVRNLN
jgi:formylglycine-generating enzyme